MELLMGFLRHTFYFSFLSFVIFPAYSQLQQTLPENFVLNLLKTEPENFSGILSNPSLYRVQIVYTQINRDSNNFPRFLQSAYRYNPKEYYYPASLVKIPTAALALEKLNDLHIPGLDKFSRLKIDSAFVCQSRADSDSTSQSGFPSIAHYVKKAFLVSDNDAYNRLYEFTGQEWLNKRLWEMGYTSARILHRFKGGCDTLYNRYTNPMAFYDSSDKIIYSQPIQFNEKLFQNPYGAVHIGKGYYDSRSGKYVPAPMDFTYSNFISIKDIEQILISIIFPEAVPKKQRFHLNDDDYRFLYKYFSMYPRESAFPHYDTTVYHDSFKKYLFYRARDSVIHSSIRIFNHVGQAYGFMADCAYFADFDNKVEFFLSAVIYANKDGILNDGKYEYDEIAAPFFANLGKLFYKYELKRHKKFLPDLSRFKTEYSK